LQTCQQIPCQRGASRHDSTRNRALLRASDLTLQ
jgi:hypothetical protein